MGKIKHYCPPWTWWIRSGERLSLGIPLQLLLAPHGLKGAEIRTGLKRVGKGIAGGMPLVRAMKESGMRLTNEAWCLLESGEITGHLGEAMRDVGELIRERARQKRELAGQLWYPLLVVLMGILVMAVILFWVVPRMREISRSMGTGDHLPWLTEHIGNLYGSAFGSCLLLALGALWGGTGLHVLGRRSLRWARIGEEVNRFIPVFGQLRNRLREAGLWRQAGTLLKGGVTLPDALRLAAESAHSRWVALELMDFRKRLLMGASMQEAFESCRLIESGNVPLLLAGQETGQLDTYMLRLAHDLQQQVAWSLGQLTRLLEPAVLLVLACAIGGLVLAYLLPMVQLLEQAGSTL